MTRQQDHSSTTKCDPTYIRKNTAPRITPKLDKVAKTLQLHSHTLILLVPPRAGHMVRFTRRPIHQAPSSSALHRTGPAPTTLTPAPTPKIEKNRHTYNSRVYQTATTRQGFITYIPYALKLPRTYWPYCKHYGIPQVYTPLCIITPLRAQTWWWPPSGRNM